MKDYEKRVLKFCYKYNFTFAEWRDEKLWCFTEWGDGYDVNELPHIKDETRHEWLVLEDVLRQRGIKPFALDTPRSEMNR